MRRNGVERPDCDAHQREQLVNDRRGCGEEHRGDPASAETCPINQRHALNLDCVLKLSPQGFHCQAD